MELDALCPGCKSSFSVPYTQDWLGVGAAGQWVGCPHCTGIFLLVYAHDGKKITATQTMATSFHKDEKQWLKIVEGKWGVAGRI